MFGPSLFLIILGTGIIWYGSRQSSDNIRKIGMGLLIAGFVLIALGRLDIPIMPN